MGSRVKKNICIVIMYDGNCFGGWQRILGEDLRGRGKSVQGYLEGVISAYFGDEIKVIGSGRTDKGVHSFGQTANFHSYVSVDIDLERVRDELNYKLGEEIQIVTMYEVDKGFHSRYDAVGKIYKYRILNEEDFSVFLRGYVYHVADRLDAEKMREAAQLFVGTHDFRGFSTFRKDVRTYVRTIDFIQVEEVLTCCGRELREVVITVCGNGFLYHMVRILAGTLIEIGLGKMDSKRVKEVLKNQDRSLSGPTVYGEGLYLHKVKYK